MPDTAPPDKTTAQLEAELATIKKQLADLAAKLEKVGKQVEPAEPFKPEPRRAWDPTANMGMSRSVVQEMARAVPDRLMADLRADALKPNPITQSTSMLPDRGGSRVEIRGSGWANPNPLGSPAGVDLCDRLVDAQDVQDRADLERRLARSVKKE